VQGIAGPLDEIPAAMSGAVKPRISHWSVYFGNFFYIGLAGIRNERFVYYIGVEVSCRERF